MSICLLALKRLRLDFTDSPDDPRWGWSHGTVDRVLDDRAAGATLTRKGCEVRIEPMADDVLPEAKALVSKVFSYDRVFVEGFFLVYAHRESAFGRALGRLGGIREFVQLYVALGDDGGVIGTTGLYRTYKDADEAVWLSWFCIDPAERGKGLGGRLLDFSIARARSVGARRLRLLTSTRASEAVAQVVYERRGLIPYKSYGISPGYWVVLRELVLE